jgi:hypothetical protein
MELTGIAFCGDITAMHESTCRQQEIGGESGNWHTRTIVDEHIAAFLDMRRAPRPE